MRIKDSKSHFVSKFSTLWVKSDDFCKCLIVRIGIMNLPNWFLKIVKGIPQYILYLITFPFLRSNNSTHGYSLRTSAKILLQTNFMFSVENKMTQMSRNLGIESFTFLFLILHWWKATIFSKQQVRFAFF